MLGFRDDGLPYQVHLNLSQGLNASLIALTTYFQVVNPIKLQNWQL